MFEQLAVKKFDKKQLIKVLQSMSDNYIYIQIDKKSREVIVKDSKTVTIIQSK